MIWPILAILIILLIAAYICACYAQIAKTETACRKFWQEHAAQKSFDAKVWHGHYAEARKALEKIERKLMEIGEK